MCERGSLRVSRARCWAVESRVMNESIGRASQDEAESPGEYAMRGADFRMISQAVGRARAMRKRDSGVPLLTFP